MDQKKRQSYLRNLVWVGLIVGVTAFAVVITSGPSDLSAWRIVAAFVALVLGAFAVWIPLGYISLGIILDDEGED